MDSRINLLITICCDRELVRCALQCPGNALPDDCILYPMQWNNRAQIHALLPKHIRDLGPIVEVQLISDVCVVEE